MDHPRSHEKKNNIKTLPIGIGGIVLFAGALVTGTIVSALAFKTRSQRRSSSEYIKNKTSQSNILELTPEEKNKFVHSGDSNEGEDQENTLIRGDFAFQSEEFDKEEDLCLGCDDGNEEQNHLMQIDNENDEHVDVNSSGSEEGITSIQEHVEIEVLLKDIVSEASEDEDENEEGEDHQERVFMNETSTMEAACVNQVEAEDDLQVEFLEELMPDHEVAPVAQQMRANQVCETPIDDHSTAKEDSPQSQLMDKEEKGEEIAQNVEEQVMIRDGLFNEDDKEGVTLMQEHEAIEVPLKDIVSEASEDEDEDDDVDEEEGEDQENVFVNEAVTMEAASENQIKAIDNLQLQFVDELMADPEVCETFVDDQSIAKEDCPSNRLMNYEEKDKEVAKRAEEQVTIKDELFNEDEKDQSTEATIVDEMVKKDEIPHVESIKQDVAVRNEISSYDLEDSSMNEELAPEAKISKHETLENEGKHEFAREPWNFKLIIWSVMISVWCLCHWYYELPILEVSLVGSLLFMLVLLVYRNRSTYLVNRKLKHH